MKKIILLIVGFFLLSSCDDAVVYRYSLVLKNNENNVSLFDTVCGELISYKNCLTNVKGSPCFVVWEGKTARVCGNWYEKNDINSGTPNYVKIKNGYCIYEFTYKPVDCCKIGMFGNKVYPKSKRKKYSHLNEIKYE